MASKEDDPSGGSGYRRAMKDVGPYLTLGLELGLTMVAWSVIGYLLDQWLETLPWLTMAGALVGMVSVFIQLARAAKKASRGKGLGDRR